ncbi:MAG TPA: aminotransferase class I/II-fold pyridoxal phosphate-dependent enzyme [Aromatoleum sp.]|uniref:DegT/DnrJ/EryC1/StrS family aminotransferase n=1 Tax=Aromatoleum sp. TaxID=2307007 RepID=UPI002B469115|nr:aminotransferase class I/II-fold pyridoxal phosphate-dependent enzyme [Aromatoleum sp.]HJV25432.1 aminotransferase class I/II-fold pyridoxal phosphate-dependent enzyme [Aromatoleum sp.]
MIPRRRIAFEWADLGDALRALTVSPSLAAEQVRAFEGAFAAAVGVPQAIATASGRDALGLILDGLGFVPGDELVIPAYTLGELVPLIRARGIVPVPADIDPATFNVTADSVAARIGARTRGVFVVHLLGAPCDIGAICAVAERRGLAVIEDCAHALGAQCEGRAVGSFGRAALFSLEATKAVATFGGGVLTTSDDVLAAHIRARVADRPRREWPPVRKMLLKWVEEAVIRSPAYALLAPLMFSERAAGAFEKLYRGAHDKVRGNPAAFSAFQARLGLRKLARLAARQQVLNTRWEALAAQLPGRFERQQRNHHGSAAFYNFVARFDGDIGALRQAALRGGLDLGVGSEVMDDTAAMLGFGDCPGAACAFRQAVLLPLYPGLSERRFRRVVATLGRLAQEVK